MLVSYHHAIPRSLNFLACLCLCCFVKTWGELERFQQPIKNDGSLTFLVVGDWGRKGLYNQSDVAFQMGKVGEKLSIDFIVSTGDNFYENGLSRTDDPAFDESLSKIYTANILQKQWYSVLGNHDYRGNVEAQLSPMLRNVDSRWLCLRSFVVNADIAELFFIDTSPFVDKYFLKPNKHHYDWGGVLPRKQYLSNLVKDLESALQESSANWKIVVGHHTIKSIGHHGETKELVQRVLPVLEANNVDMYVNGHDHCLEHMSCPGSGGGSKAWNGDVYPEMKDEVKFYYDGQGFMSIDLTQTDATMGSTIITAMFCTSLTSLNNSSGKCETTLNQTICKTICIVDLMNKCATGTITTANGRTRSL